MIHSVQGKCFTTSELLSGLLVAPGTDCGAPARPRAPTAKITKSQLVPEAKSGFPVSLWAAIDRGGPHTPREYHREEIGAIQSIFRLFGKS